MSAAIADGVAGPHSFDAGYSGSGPTADALAGGSASATRVS
jgi:hypothetical protein